MANLLDNIIGFASPKWGYERQTWRQAFDQAFKMNFDSGNSNRLTGAWVAVNGTAEKINKAQRDILRTRARDLERNSDIASAFITALERNVIGSGIKLQVKTENEDINTQIEAAFKKWSRAKNCDLSERQSFVEIQKMAVRRLAVDGGIIFVKTIDKEGKFKLQVKEVDELDASKDKQASKSANAIVGGIEIDAYNKHLSYYFKDDLGNTSRIEADRVIFLGKIQRPTQVREISGLSIVAKRVKELNDFMEAVGVKERVMACLSIFIKKATPSSPVGRGASLDAKSGYYEKSVAPGMITELNPGDSIDQVNPNGQASNTKEFICINQRLVGAGQGLSYESVSRDMSQVNYSSARQGLLEDQKTYSEWQDYLIEHFLYQVYVWWLEIAVLSRIVEIRDYAKNIEMYQEAHSWCKPGWSWIDPQKEAKANETALNTNQTTLQQIAASKGEDWKDVLEQRAKEKELTKQLLGDVDDGKDNKDVSQQVSSAK